MVWNSKNYLTLCLLKWEPGIINHWTIFSFNLLICCSLLVIFSISLNKFAQELQCQRKSSQKAT